MKKNKAELSLEQAGDKIPEPRARKFVAAVAKRKRQREHAAKLAKKRRKAGR